MLRKEKDPFAPVVLGNVEKWFLLVVKVEILLLASMWCEVIECLCDPLANKTDRSSIQVCRDGERVLDA